MISVLYGQFNRPSALELRYGKSPTYSARMESTLGDGPGRSIGRGIRRAACFGGPRKAARSRTPAHSTGNAHLSIGTFHEGAIVSGYRPDSTDNPVQANVIAAGYR